jgi:hypothetical protein
VHRERAAPTFTVASRAKGKRHTWFGQFSPHGACVSVGQIKCPPLGMGVHQRTLYRRLAHLRGGVPLSTNWLENAAIAVGSSRKSSEPSV